LFQFVYRHLYHDADFLVAVPEPDEAVGVGVLYFEFESGERLYVICSCVLEVCCDRLPFGCWLGRTSENEPVCQLLVIYSEFVPSGIVTQLTCVFIKTHLKLSLDGERYVAAAQQNLFDIVLTC
jgi:hypothetical protein